MCLQVKNIDLTGGRKKKFFSKNVTGYSKKNEIEHLLNKQDKLIQESIENCNDDEVLHLMKQVKKINDRLIMLGGK